MRSTFFLPLSIFSPSLHLISKHACSHPSPNPFLFPNPALHSEQQILISSEIKAHTLPTRHTQLMIEASVGVIHFSDKTVLAPPTYPYTSAFRDF